MLSFTKRQQMALDAMLKGKNVFVTGPGGTGKSFIIFHYISELQFMGINKEDIAITSTTGISASLIGGTTLHSFAGVGIGNKSFEYYYNYIMEKNYFKKKQWRKCKVLIIDEVSMLSPRLFELIDCLARKIRRKREPFGGIQVILLGDFCQLPTVGEKDFCFEAVNWSEVVDETFYLNEIKRQNDATFQSVLNKIRLGEVDNEVKEVLNSRLNVKLDKNKGIRPTIIYSKRKAVENFNLKKEDELRRRGGESSLYISTYSYSEGVSDAFKDFLKRFIDSNFRVEDELRLYVGSQVMVTVNFPDMKLYNGSRGVVIGFTDDESKFPIVRFLDGREIMIEPHEFKHESDKKNYIIKKQIPLKIAWAITIHKSQGMSLDYVSTNIGKSIFEYGQVYVVLSRVRNLEGLCIKEVDYNRIMADPKVIEYYKRLE